MSILRIVSYNIHKGRSALLNRESFNALRLHLYGLRPDLLFLQEVQGRNKQASALDAQHDSLAAALGLEVAYARNAVQVHTDHGNALLSRFPILSSENQDISDHRLEHRGLLHARVLLQDQEVHCFVVHLGLFAASRTRQISALIERIERLVPEQAPLLIAGDFNDWTDRLAPLFVQRLGLYEVFSQAYTKSSPQGTSLRKPLRWIKNKLSHTFQVKPVSARIQQLSMNGANFGYFPSPRTFPAAFPWLRLDRIYQRGFAVRSARVLHGRQWARLSDHAPLLAELELP